MSTYFFRKKIRAKKTACIAIIAVTSFVFLPDGKRGQRWQRATWHRKVPIRHNVIFHLVRILNLLPQRPASVQKYSMRWKLEDHQTENGEQRCALARCALILSWLLSQKSTFRNNIATNVVWNRTETKKTLIWEVDTHNKCLAPSSMHETWYLSALYNFVDSQFCACVVSVLEAECAQNLVQHTLQESTVDGSKISSGRKCHPHTLIYVESVPNYRIDFSSTSVFKRQSSATLHRVENRGSFCQSNWKTKRAGRQNTSCAASSASSRCLHLFIDDLCGWFRVLRSFDIWATQ